MLIHLCGAKLSGCAAMNDTYPSFAHTTVGAEPRELRATKLIHLNKSSGSHKTLAV